MSLLGGRGREGGEGGREIRVEKRRDLYLVIGVLDQYSSKACSSKEILQEPLKFPSTTACVLPRVQGALAVLKTGCCKSKICTHDPLLALGLALLP